MVVSPRDAFLGEAEIVAVGDAIGRVSCESIAGYPPGIPALLPGERITDETISYLRETFGRFQRALRPGHIAAHAPNGPCSLTF